MTWRHHPGFSLQMEHPESAPTLRRLGDSHECEQYTICAQIPSQVPLVGEFCVRVIITESPIHGSQMTDIRTEIRTMWGRSVGNMVISPGHVHPHRSSTGESFLALCLLCKMKLQQHTPCKVGQANRRRGIRVPTCQENDS